MSVLSESLYYKEYARGQNDRLPQYITHNSHNSRRYLVMQYLEQSIEEYLD